MAARGERRVIEDGAVEQEVNSADLQLRREAAEAFWVMMKSKNVNQRELAERIGVSRGLIGHWLHGDKNVTVRTLAAMGHALGFRFALSFAPEDGRGWGAASTVAHDDEVLYMMVRGGESRSGVRQREYDPNSGRARMRRASGRCGCCNHNAHRGERCECGCPLILEVTDQAEAERILAGVNEREEA